MGQQRLGWSLRWRRDYELTMFRAILTLMIGAAFLLTGGCGKKPDSAPESAGGEAGVESAEIVVAKPAPESPAGAPTPQATILETPKAESTFGGAGDLAEPVMPDLDAAAQKPAQLAGSYRDPTAPAVLYELRPDGSWQATWESEDGKKGLRMKGTYKTEYGMARLLCTSVVRKDLISGDYKRERVPPAPQPRCLFTITGDKLIMVPDMADPAFVIEPFSATRLEKVVD
jgi:hypothetical protein